VVVKSRREDNSQFTTYRAGRQTVAFVALAIGLLSLFGFAAAPQLAWCHDEVKLDRVLIGYDIADLPTVPTPKQQIEAGRKQIDVAREDDPGLDSNAEVHDYFNLIASKLLAASEQKPFFPIEVHVASVPINNAEVIPLGRSFSTSACLTPLIMSRNWSR
jgi:hypothetical protein